MLNCNAILKDTSLVARSKGVLKKHYC